MFKKILCAFSVFILFLVALEFILKVINSHYNLLEPKPLYNYSQDSLAMFTEYDPLLGWKNKPNSKGFFTMPDSKSYVEINSYGCRNREYPLKKYSKKRIIAYGDSYTWGYGINNNEIFTEILEKKLNGDKIEIINFGVPGYGTDQEYLSFKKYGIQWKPDIVIVMLHTRDIEVDNICDFEHGVYKPLFAVDGNSLRLASKIPLPRIEKSPALTTPYSSCTKCRNKPILYQLIGKRIKLLFSDIQKSNKLLWKLSLKFRVNEHEYGYKITKKILEELNKDTEKIGAKLIVVSVYEEAHIKKNPPLYMIFLKDFLEAHNITYIDTYNDFYRESKKNSLFFEHDLHWNAKAHEIVAAVLYRELKKLNLLENIYSN